ncbi:predicted protein [Botrytis cinerea T4]|uniref:Uncharacterized protein n=1 Tax=Botryotinia fuckeliana (strain T4) TaxID=999810 RepID=G2Y2F5_BOTF4|nr:predicted protein [Botrytis cinerea T4]
MIILTSDDDSNSTYPASPSIQHGTIPMFQIHWKMAGSRDDSFFGQVIRSR